MKSSKQPISTKLPLPEPLEAAGEITKLPRLSIGAKKDNLAHEQAPEKSSETETRQVLPEIAAAGPAPAAASHKPSGKTGADKSSTVRRAPSSKSMGPDQDVSGSVFFLRGKLKEMTDLIGGAEPLRQRRAGRSGELLKLLALLLRGEDEDTEKVRRGRSLDDTSRHRPDLAADPDVACARFTDPGLAALRRFPEAAAARITLAWETSAADYMLAATIPELLRHLEGDAGGTERGTARRRRCA